LTPITPGSKTGKEVVILYTCPHCEQPVEAEPEHADEPLVCPHCGAEFVVEPVDVDPPPHGYAADDAESSPDRDRELLNNLRIRQISLEKRALLRQRSIRVAGGFACILLAAQLLWIAIRDLRAEGVTLQPIVFIVATGVLGIGAIVLFRSARRLRQQFEQKAPQDQELPPPDFTNLSDGSQHWKNLEEIR
jgi:DNA-directed RNA polymerase subunit RPC12/RpoP